MITKNIELIEGLKHELRFVLTGVDDVGDFEPFGYVSPLGCNHQSWKIEKVDESYFIPALKNGIYNYQIFVKQLSTNKDFLTLEGKIEVKNSLMAENNSSLGETELLVSFDANTTEIHCEITKGVKGDNGLSTYEIAKEHGFIGTEKEWLNSLKEDAASIAINEVKPMVEYVSNAVEEIEAKKEVILSAQNEIEENKNIVLENSYKAENSATNAKASEENAEANKEKVEELHSEIQELNSEIKINAQKAETSANSAANSEQVSIAKAEAASVSETNAAHAATNAANSASNAETSANNAAQSATEAANSVELLGDAALKSGDNIFTGNNVFSGETWGVLPIDFYKFSWCKTHADMKIICPTWAGLKNVCVDLSNLDEPEYYGVMDPDADILENVFFYFSGDIKRIGTLNGRQPSTAKNPLKSFTVYAPNATKCGRFRLPPNVEEVKIITPNTVFHTACFDWAKGLKRIYFITKNTRLAKTKAGMFGAGWPHEYVQEIHAPLNILTSVELPDFFALHTIGYGFPSATIINLQKASLNKASVMAILNALQTYDATTMESVPELTLGIDPTLDGDAEINEALLLAQTAVEDGGKGWSVAVNGFTITAGGGATMALRKPIFAKRWQDADGGYIDAEGVRYSIRYGNTVLENWIANEQLGYTEFATIEDALTEWGLREYQPETTEEQ